MNRSFVNRASFAALAASVLAVGGQALAGGVLPYFPVRVQRINSAGTMYAAGVMADARASADATQGIGCSVQSQFQSVAEYLQCSAVSASGARAGCYLDWRQPGFAGARDAVLSAGSHSFIEFNVGGSGQCIDLRVYNDSSFLPPRPAPPPRSIGVVSPPPLVVR